MMSREGTAMSAVMTATTGTNVIRKLERRLRMSNFKSRAAMMEREKAMEAARNPGVSKFGDCLVNMNSKSDKMLQRQLGKIQSEIKRMELQIKQQKKLFIRNSGVLNHEPLILVERPPSPEVVKRATTILYQDYDPELDDVPGYMKPLRSQTKTPSTLTTIDVFTVKPKKKRNVWEEAMDEKEAPQFQSTVRPSAKLTKREKSDLHLGYNYHKPKLTPDTGYTSDTTDDGHKRSSTPRKRKKKKDRKALVEAKPESDESDFDEITPFITQMAEVKQKRSKKYVENETKLPEVVQTGKGKEPLDSSAKAVRFKSPVLTSPIHRKLKTQATKVTYIQVQA